MSGRVERRAAEQGKRSSPLKKDAPIGEQLPRGPERLEGSEASRRSQDLQATGGLMRAKIRQDVPNHLPLSVDLRAARIHKARVRLRPSHMWRGEKDSERQEMPDSPDEEGSDWRARLHGLRLKQELFQPDRA